MEVKPGSVIATMHIVASVINAVTSSVNGKKSRELQADQAEKSRALNLEIEENRQNFQLETHELNARRQREMNEQAHTFRLEEQQRAFENACMQTEWNQFIARWPLVNLPSVIRAQQLLSDDTVSLRVIFSRSADADFSRYVYPYVEQGLRDFVDIYHNAFASRNIIFYHNAFNSNVVGGAVEANIHYGLRELPVIIIGTNVLPDQVDISLTMWGLADQRAYPDHMSMFKMPFVRSDNPDDYREMASQILRYLKFIVGFTYDAYNLTEYSRMPLLPKVAQYEQMAGMQDCMLDAPELKASLGRKYNDIYAGIIGSGSAELSEGSVFAPSRARSMEMPRIRLEYAETMRTLADKDMYTLYLDESVQAWAALRTQEEPAAFLSGLSGDPGAIVRYVSAEDKAYILRLAQGYAGANDSPEGKAVRALAEALEGMELRPRPQMPAAKEAPAPACRTEKKKPQRDIVVF